VGTFEHGCTDGLDGALHVTRRHDNVCALRRKDAHRLEAEIRCAACHDRRFPRKIDIARDFFRRGKWPEECAEGFLSGSQVLLLLRPFGPILSKTTGCSSGLAETNGGRVQGSATLCPPRDADKPASR